MANSYDYLLLGGGTSCAYAAVALREHDKNGSVAILGAESEPPYDRPPFTKYFLWNDEKKVDDFHSKDESFYPENHVELLMGKRAVGIDRAAKKVKAEGGEEYGYGKLLYALGSEPKRLPVEGADSAWVLRTAEDSARIRNAAVKGAKAVLIGGGYIGAELASSLVGRGCEVWLLEVGDRVWPLFPSKAVAERVTKELERMGVHVERNARATRIEGGKTVHTQDGRKFDGDFVVMGVGAAPRIGLAKESGLNLGGQGVRADSRLRTSDPSIWASGDVVEYDDSRIGAPYRIEHHLHAKGSAMHAARVMAGQESDFDGVPYFFSDVGDLSMNLRGYPERAAQAFLVGDDEAPVITEVSLFDDGTIAAMVDLRKDYKAQDPICELFEKLIKQRKSAKALEQELRNPSFDPMSLEKLL